MFNDSVIPTAWGDKPEGNADRAARQTRVAAVLMTYCDPKVKYDGVSTWEIAGKILDALQEAQS